MKILVVDDDAHIQRICIEEFGDRGHEVIAAGTGTEGIELYKQEIDSIDVVLLDILLPDIDGIRVLRKMIEINPYIPKGMYSAYDYRDDFAIWASHFYVVKSSDMSELIAMVEKYGGKYRQQEAKNKL